MEIKRTIIYNILETHSYFFGGVVIWCYMMTVWLVFLWPLPPEVLRFAFAAPARADGWGPRPSTWMSLGSAHAMMGLGSASISREWTGKPGIHTGGTVAGIFCLGPVACRLRHQPVGTLPALRMSRAEHGWNCKIPNFHSCFFCFFPQGVT